MFTHEEVISRLEEAGRTLLSLPPERAAGHCRTSIWEYVREPVHSMAFPRKSEPTPSPKDVSRMDEALRWPVLIPLDKFVLRRIVCARMMVSPRTGRHLFPWRRIGTLLGADHKAIQRWHEQGIHIITGNLQAQKRAA
jgi:hypothetical protein